jgi:hypothetical protein
VAISWQWDFAKLAEIMNRWPRKDQAASRFPIWALWTVESLDYLAMLDDETMGPPARSPYGYGPDVVEIAHTRWAAGSAVTALDLCAAMLAVRHGSRPVDSHSASLGDFVPKHQRNMDAKKRAQDLRDAVPHAARAWISAVWGDPEYQTVRRARNPLTHSSLPRLVRGSMGGAQTPERSTLLPVGPNKAWLSSGELVRKARDIAVQHVAAFFDGRPAQQF